MWNHIKLVRKIKALLPLNIKLILIRILVFLQKIFYQFFTKEIEGVSNEKRVIYLLLSTDYSNLGDHAMTYTQKLKLTERYPHSQIIEVLVGDTLKHLNYIEKIIKKDDVITLKGGGNIGLEYFREELYRREIINRFKNNRIIIFPQTVYFPNTYIGKREFEKTRNIFMGNSNLYLFTRDQPSYNQLRDDLNSRIFLVPDTVLLLDDIESDLIRSGAMTAMRSDVEGKYSTEQKSELIELLEKYYGKVKIADTTTEYPIPIIEREKELQKNWNLFLSSEIVVTDRLHGMIFAAITKTPCIVFNTYNHKLIGQYEWLKHLEYIKFIDFDLIEVEKLIEEIKGTGIKINERKRYEEYYENIFNLI
jgi:pyruvyl transferase EpsI